MVPIELVNSIALGGVGGTGNGGYEYEEGFVPESTMAEPEPFNPYANEPESNFNLSNTMPHPKHSPNSKYGGSSTPQPW